MKGFYVPSFTLSILLASTNDDCRSSFLAVCTHLLTVPSMPSTTGRLGNWTSHLRYLPGGRGPDNAFTGSTDMESYASTSALPQTQPAGLLPPQPQNSNTMIHPQQETTNKGKAMTTQVGASTHETAVPETLLSLPMAQFRLHLVNKTLEQAAYLCAQCRKLFSREGAKSASLRSK